MCIRDPEREALRLKELYRYNILDTKEDESFDRLTRLTAQVLDVPIALINFIDSSRQWSKSRQGAPIKEMPRDTSFCTHTIEYNEAMIISDLRKDQRFEHNPFVTADPHVRFYAGVPLAVKSGFNLGTLCILDYKPRRLKDRQISALVDFAKIVIDEIELCRRAETDFLTGAATRQVMASELTKAVERFKRTGANLSIIALDIDHFKSINDQFGHGVGDKVLQALVNHCKKNLRVNDVIARAGGEEFLILLPDTTIDGAMHVAEEFRKFFEQNKIDKVNKYMGFTCSFGVTTIDKNDLSIDALLERADKALYKAKEFGRNRIVRL